MKKYIFFRQVLFFFLIVVIWQSIYISKIWPSYLFPSLQEVFLNLIYGFLENDYTLDIIVSLRRLAVGCSISIFIGIPLGILLYRFLFLQQTLGILILGLQTLPSICWLPLSILWFGLNEAAIIFVIVIGTTLSITLGTQSALAQVSPLWIKAAYTLGAKNLNLFRLVILPAAWPGILSGFKQGWSFAWRSLMAAEILFMNQGLGHILNIGREMNDMSQVIAIILIIICLGIVVDVFLFKFLEKKNQIKWGLSNL